MEKIKITYIFSWGIKNEIIHAYNEKDAWNLLGEKWGTIDKWSITQKGFFLTKEQLTEFGKALLNEAAEKAKVIYGYSDKVEGNTFFVNKESITSILPDFIKTII